MLVSSASFADDGRYQDYAVGARSMGLGGAYGAIADDASGIFFNPAGLVDVTRPRVSVSTSLYGMEFQGTSPIDSAVVRLERGFSAADLIILPSSTGAVWGFAPLPNGRFKHAVAFATQVPGYTSRTITSFENDIENGRTLSLRSTLNDRLLFGGVGYAYRGTPWFRIGVGLHYVFRTIDAEESFADISLTNPGQFAFAQSRLRTTYHGLRAALGLKLRPHPRWSFGLTLTSPSLGLWRSTIFESLSINATDPSQPAIPDDIRIERDSVDLQSRQPMTLRLGVAYEERKNFTISCDILFYAPSSYRLIPQEDIEASAETLSRVPIPLHIERGPSMNANVGFEKLLTNTFSISAGVFTNFSAAPDLEVQDGYLTADSSRLSTVDMIGFSFALGFFGEHALSRLGITGSTGYGNVVQSTAPRDRIFSGRPPLAAVPAAQTFLFLYWSSTFRFGSDEPVRGFSL